ncbi:MAG TPA: helix-turn-helix domain-containing protein, partial [Dissulfurispiraceae bacterium]
RRVGGNKTLKVDARIIAATNRNMPELIESGAFRKDLYFRLNVITITIPPLRERREDIEELAGHFLEKYRHKLAKPVSAFGKDALEALAGYDWPGNVRELENVVERAVILCDSEEIGKGELSIAAASAPAKGTSPASLEDMEKEHILKVLRETDGNQSLASQILGIDRKTLYLKLKKYGIRA